MDVDKRAEDAAADPQAQLTSTSSWTNLNTFSSRGGKLLFYHGVSDPWFSALDTVDYYERMARGERRRVRVRTAGAGSSWCPAWATAAAARRRSTASTCWAPSSTGSRTRRPRRPSATGALARPQPAAVPVPVARALQGHGRPRGRRVVRVPLANTTPLREEQMLPSLARRHGSFSRGVRLVLTFALMAAAAIPSAAAADAVALSVDGSKPGAAIDRDIFGQFAEHLGTGSTVGSGSAATLDPERPRHPQRRRRRAQGDQGAGRALARRLLRRRIPLAKWYRPGAP